jgi:hypothetical protein
LEIFHFKKLLDVFFSIQCTVAFTYVSNEEYVKKVLLDTSTSSQLETVNKFVQEADFAGNAVFLPPRYFKIAEIYKAYIPKNKNSKLPPPEIF